ncbi:albusnodin family lasso peptide [Nocardiopsis exhalans]|uniref:Albusnodin family lasso peptide n=1 Tax=Nocardiopsis exhalans TaxID=163604 RepID=A0ABY5D0L7_9ACTN|nr:albusnodin family lasso peptide [Nocardiopsis exhalans]USY17460.1 albusnodin family lasso peptide [Nocardiopsis exhalans]
MQDQSRSAEAAVFESDDSSSVVVELGDAVELTEGTSSRSGSEDKRYKYQ